MARPSPRTGSTGAGIQKFGTQQLKYLNPDKPALGVIETDYGAPFRLSIGGEATTPKTPFSQKYQDARPATIRTFQQLATSPHAPPVGFGTFEFPDLFGDLFKPKDNGEDCGWFGEKCWEKDNGEDCGWFGEKCWFKELPDLSWLKWVFLAIGIGILLWLLRPLFSMIAAFKGGSP